MNITWHTRQREADIKPNGGKATGKNAGNMTGTTENARNRRQGHDEGQNRAAEKMDEVRKCSECNHAKPKPDEMVPLWFCGKHRKYITKHTTVSITGKRRCKEYEERK